MSQSTSAVDEPGTATLTEIERHRLLASAERRAVLGLLAERSYPLDLRELAAAVAAETTSAETDDESAVDSTAAALHHNHLPAMADLGAIDYDAATNVVESCNVCPATLLE